MKFKYKEQEIDVPDNFIILCGQHAEQRGMTLEEYISEAFTKLNQSEKTESQKDWSYDANGTPINENSS